MAEDQPQLQVPVNANRCYPSGADMDLLRERDSRWLQLARSEEKLFANPGHKEWGVHFQSSRIVSPYKKRSLLQTVERSWNFFGLLRKVHYLNVLSRSDYHFTAKVFPSR